MLFGVNLEVKDLTLVATNYVNNVFIHGKASVWVSKGRVTTSMHGSKVFYYKKLPCPFVCVFVSVPTFFRHDRLTANKVGTRARIDPGMIRAQTNLTHPTPRGSQGGLWGQQFKSPGNVMSCPENQ